MHNAAAELHVVVKPADVADQVELRFIYVSEGKVLQQVPEGMDVKFLSQQFSPLRPYPFQVFDRIG